MRDALTWYVVVQVAALAAWPAVARELAPLDDRGWGAAKAAGVLALASLVWFVCMLRPIPVSRATLVIALFLVALASWGWSWRTDNLADIFTWMRERLVLIGTWEILFAAAFVAFAVLRAHEPAINAFEKPM